MTPTKPQHGGPRTSADPNAHRGPVARVDPGLLTAVAVRLDPEEIAALDAMGGKRAAVLRRLLREKAGL